MNDALTILLVTRNRQRMAQQTLDAYLRFMPRENIILADGTGTDESPWARIERLSLDVTTPFAVAASDDDLLLEGGLRASVDFLRDNSDYSACHGIYYGARLVGEEFRLRTLYKTLPNSSDNPTARLFFLFTRCQGLFYAVHRTEVLRHSFAMPAAFDRYNFNELICNMRTIVAGKVGALDIPYMVSNEQLSFSAARDDTDGSFTNYVHPTVLWLHDPGDFAARYTAFRQSVSPHIRDERLLNIAYVIFWQRHFETSTILKYLSREGICTENDSEMLRDALETSNSGEVPDLSDSLAPLRANGWPGYL